MAKVSVIMSVYREDVSWIRLSVESIINQTFGDFEYIIVNDDPESVVNKKVISEYANKDSRIKLIENGENIGLTKSLNKALAIAEGKYIARMDADDYSHSTRFEKQVIFLDSHPEIVMVGCYARVMDETGRVVDEMHTSNDYMILSSMMPFIQPIYHPSMMYRREIDGIPIQYNEDMRVSQDYELCSRLIKYPLSNIPEYLLDYRMSAKQMTKVNKANYITKDAPIRKKLLHQYYNSITDQDAEAFISMYYLQQIDKAKIKDMERFILHLYFNNEKNQDVYIAPAMTFILVRYFKFLRVNGTLMFTFKKYISINQKLGNRFYGMVLGHILNKVTTKVKYRILNKRCSI